MKIRIKELCEMHGIESAYRLAKESGLNMPTAYRAFADDIKHFTPDTLEKLCKALQCTPNDIFGYAPQAKKPESKTMLSIEATAAKLKQPKSKVNAMIRDGRIQSEKVGGRRLINEKDLANSKPKKAAK
jgi:putative transcriptional regulator